MLSWVSRFNICCFLDNQQFPSSYHSYECLAGAGATNIFVPEHNFLPALTNFLTQHDDWIFGHFNYELFAKEEPAESDSFPTYLLFVPEVVLQLFADRLVIGVLTGNAAAIYAAICVQPLSDQGSIVQFQANIARKQYLDTVAQLQQHIKKGDCYEINFCQSFVATGVIEPTNVFQQLTRFSPNPFSAFYRVFDHFLLSSSPERYMKKQGNRLISQPIKGTSARDITDEAKDKDLRQTLQLSTKDRSENVMIVDLVRNDLSKICLPGTVRVEELFGIYTFTHLHHLISTISGVLQPGAGLPEVLEATFPMGSMTGAPKKKVMELIARYENGKRGIYSGTVGYISPEKDFDFSVVIRSLVYDQKAQQLSFHVGSAITTYSDPEKEYEECLLKGAAMMKVFL